MGGEYRETITARLKLAVYRSKMTRKGIAEKAGIREGTLDQYLYCGVMPGADKLAALCQALEVDPGWVMGVNERRRLSMTGTEYQQKAMRTASEKSKMDLLENGVMGLCGEAGECIDVVKKYLYQGHKLDKLKLKDELGDVLWYVAITCQSLGITLDDVMEHNVKKLLLRYPDGFEAERSIHREV